MDAAPNPVILPPPDQVREQIAAAEAEVKALRRLLRVSVAAARAREAREHRESLCRRGNTTTLR